MAESKKRIALKPHIDQIREWVDEGKADEWIADALGTSASSVQSFRSRNDIYRRERGNREPESVFEGVLDHGEREGWGMWFDPSISDDPIWQEHWSGVEAVVVKVAEDSIVLEADRGEGVPAAAAAPPAREPEPRGEDEVVAVPNGTAEEDLERGRVKWFDPEKGYGFLVRPTGEDLFVHHSEVEGNPADLGPNGEVEYVVGQNDRGPNARRVRLLG